MVASLITFSLPTGSSGGARALASEAQPDDGLGVDDLPGGDQPRGVCQRDLLDGHPPLLGALPVGGNLSEVAGQVQPGVLVAAARGVVEAGEELEPPGLPAHLLG